MKIFTSWKSLKVQARHQLIRINYTCGSINLYTWGSASSWGILIISIFENNTIFMSCHSILTQITIISHTLWSLLIRRMQVVPKSSGKFSSGNENASFHRDKVICTSSIAWRAAAAWDNAMAPEIIRVPSLNALPRQIIKPYRLMHSIICILVKAFLGLFHHCGPWTSGAARLGSRAPPPSEQWGREIH